MADAHRADDGRPDPAPLDSTDDRTDDSTDDSTDTVPTEAVPTAQAPTEALHTDAPHTEALHTEVLHTDYPDHPYPAPGPTGVLTTPTPTAGRQRGPDPLALVVGLATLAMAVFAFVGQLPDLSGFDPRWLLAGGAAVVGLALLLGSLRGRSGGRRRPANGSTE